MLITTVKEGESIERAIKRFKRKHDKTGVTRRLRERMQYTKPSVRKRQVIQKARHVQKYRDNE